MDECQRPVKTGRRVGYWLTEKKIRRLNFDAFESLCRLNGIEMVKLNFDRPLEQQGPFHLILHKVTDQLALTVDSSQSALRQIDTLQSYVTAHPDVKCIDPINNVMKLLDRHQQYQIVRDGDNVDDPECRYFIPSFAEFTTNSVAENLRLMAENEIAFPIVCKPNLSHCNGGCAPGLPLQAEREEMAIVFNAVGLSDIETPCIAQSFVNHNARLFKIFIIGSKHFIIQRPSIKNFRSGHDTKTIFFNSNDVSKSYSSSHLNRMLHSEVDFPIIEPDEKKMLNLVSVIQKKFGLDLLGIDVIIENGTGRYGVIDINAFPGYDGVDLFFPSLLELMEDKMADIPPLPNRTLVVEPEILQTSTESENQLHISVAYQPCNAACDSANMLIPSYPQRDTESPPTDLASDVLGSNKWYYFTASFCADYLKPATCGGHIERPLVDSAANNAREQQAVTVNGSSRR